MHSTQPDSDDIKTPFNDFDMDPDASPLISDIPRPSNASLVQKVELKPWEQQRIHLGNYTDSVPPKGFSIEITPDPNPARSVLTEVASIGTKKKYRLVLHITNFGTGTVSAEIWQL